MMDIQLAFFYAFSVILLLSAVCVITAKNPIHAALFLVLAFFSAAALWMLVQAEFLAISLVLVYVGAVMVFFLFVVMMLDINLDRMRKGFWSSLPLAVLVGSLMAFEIAAVLVKSYWLKDGGIIKLAEQNNTLELGRLLYTEYLYPFEVAALILLVAMVAAIALTLRGRKDSKFQSVAEQVRTRKQDRLRVVSVAPVNQARQDKLASLVSDDNATSNQKEAS